MAAGRETNSVSATVSNSDSIKARTSSGVFTCSMLYLRNNLAEIPIIVAGETADFFAECTVTGYRDNEVLVSVEAYDENGEETLDEGHVVFTSEYLYHAEDLKYLALHPEYFSLFVSFLLFEQEDAQILFDMIEDCVLYYYPETKDEILRLSKEMEAEFAADSTTSTNSPSNAT